MLFVQTQINRRAWNNGKLRQAGMGRWLGGMEAESSVMTSTLSKQFDLFFSCQSNRDGGIECSAHLSKDIVVNIDTIRFDCSFNSPATHHGNADYHSYTVIEFQFTCSCAIDADEETKAEDSVTNTTWSASLPGNATAPCAFRLPLIWRYFFMNSQRHKLVMPQARNLNRRLVQKVISPLNETRLKRQQLLVFNIDLSIRNTMRRDILESSQHVWRKGNHLRAYSQDIRQRVEDDAIKAYSAKGKYFRFSIFPFRRTRIPSVVLRWLCKCSSYFIYSFFVISFRFCRILAEAVSISIHSGWERRRQCQMFHIDEYSGQFTKSQLHAHECSADSANRQFIHDDWNKSGATEIKDDVPTLPP